MGILVDYACPGCLGRHEARVASPPPRTRRCPTCGCEAVRSWSPVGILRGGVTGAPEGTNPVAPRDLSRPLCASNPDVPGLCHMSPEAGRLWVARAHKDSRSLERELERQERAVSDGSAPPVLSIGGHHHSHHHHSSDGDDHHGVGPGRDHATVQK